MQKFIFLVLENNSCRDIIHLNKCTARNTRTEWTPSWDGLTQSYDVVDLGHKNDNPEIFL
jgi:hypothetical protein